MLKQIFVLFLITLIPALELRASIPFGFGLLGKHWLGFDFYAMPWWLVAVVCMIANIILGWAVFGILAPVMKWLERFAWFRRWLEPVLLRAQKKIQPYVEKFGEFGVALFIGVPLPGSGVYTGAVGAFLLGLDRKKFAVANVLGVLISGLAVTVICLGIKAGMDIPFSEFMIKQDHHSEQLEEITPPPHEPVQLD
ncbi:MAG: small multi-drug export protein [Lentisphaeria bacterium]|nr:small multi-drug export protein [Lentisphaeria bacterium]